MTTREAVSYPHDALLTVEELVSYLRVNKDMAYELVNTGTIPNVKIGRQARIPFWGVLQWVAAQSGAAYPESTTAGEVMEH